MRQARMSLWPALLYYKFGHLYAAFTSSSVFSSPRTVLNESRKTYTHNRSPLQAGSTQVNLRGGGEGESGAAKTFKTFPHVLRGSAGSPGGKKRTSTPLLQRMSPQKILWKEGKKAANHTARERERERGESKHLHKAFAKRKCNSFQGFQHSWPPLNGMWSY